MPGLTHQEVERQTTKQDAPAKAASVPSSPNGPLVRASLDRAGPSGRAFVAAGDGRDALVMVTSASEVLLAPRRDVGSTNPRAAPRHRCSGHLSVRPSPPTGRMWRVSRVRDVILRSNPADQVTVMVDAGEAGQASRVEPNPEPFRMLASRGPGSGESLAPPGLRAAGGGGGGRHDVRLSLRPLQRVVNCRSGMADRAG